MFDYIDVQELAMHLLGIEDDGEDHFDEVDRGLFTEYGIYSEQLASLISKLVPLIDAKQGMDGKIYKGISDQKGMWLIKIEAK